MSIQTNLIGQQLSTSVNAEAAILINADTGAILFEKQPDKSLYPASLTKIATTLYALERGGISLDSMITAEAEALTPTTESAKKRANYTLPAYWLENDGTHIGLKKGEQLALRDLLYGIMMRSGNDASNAVALYIGGSIPQYMQEINAYLKGLGCQSTRYLNPHGLHHPDHVTTARDQARLAQAALKNPVFCEIVSTLRYTRPTTNLQGASTWTHSNLLLRKGPCYYAKALGIKTGYHARAQHNLVAAAKQGDRTLIAVLMQNPGRKEMFKEAIRLFELAFQQPKVERTLLEAGLQPFALKLPGSSKPIATYIPEKITHAYYPAEEPELKAMLFWNERMTLPISKGQQVGEIRLTAEEGRIIQSIPLYAAQEVRPSMLHRLKRQFTGVPSALWVTILGVGFAILGYLFLRRRQHLQRRS